MNYGLLFLCFLVLPFRAHTQPVGLGRFVLGVTTPESLPPPFAEKELVVIKGTLALPCPHIRLFAADTVTVEGVPVAAMALVFYDNVLFRITCEYSELLSRTFVRKYGKGVPGPERTLSLCQDKKGSPLLLQSQRWPVAEKVIITAIRASGYTLHCQKEQRARLTLVSQPVLELASACDFDSLDPYFEQVLTIP